MKINRRVALLSGMAASIFAQTPGAPANPSSTLSVGSKPPDFTLASTDGGNVHLADLIGKSTLVLAFFPAAFTGG
jgi:hypothetical protein